MGVDSYADLNIFLSFVGEDEITARKIKIFFTVSCKRQNILIEIYFAPINNRVGEDWHNRILKEIRKSNVVIVLWTNNSPKSMGQLIEVGAAWALEKNIFAILDGVSYETLPPMVLSRVQSIPYGQLATLNCESLFDFEN